MQAGGRAACPATPGQVIRMSGWPAGGERRLPSVVLETNGRGPSRNAHLSWVSTSPRCSPNTLPWAELLTRTRSGLLQAGRPRAELGGTCPPPPSKAQDPSRTRSLWAHGWGRDQCVKVNVLLGCTESRSFRGSHRLDSTCQAPLVPSCFASLSPGQALRTFVAPRPLAHV